MPEDATRLQRHGPGSLPPVRESAPGAGRRRGANPRPDIYEAGYDYRKAPNLWRRFAAKYGDQDKVTNFFFGDHSLSAKRAKDLEREIARNYSNPAKDPPTHTVVR